MILLRRGGFVGEEFFETVSFPHQISFLLLEDGDLRVGVLLLFANRAEAGLQLFFLQMQQIRVHQGDQFACLERLTFLGFKEKQLAACLGGNEGFGGFEIAVGVGGGLFLLAGGKQKKEGEEWL